MAKKGDFRYRDDVQSYVEKMSKKGATTSQIEKGLKEKFGKGYRRQNIQEDIRRYQQKPKKTDTEKYTPAKYRYRWTDPKDKLHQYDKTYNHMVAFQTKDKVTGEIKDKSIFISTNRVVKPSEIVKMAIEALSRNEENYKETETLVKDSVKYVKSFFEPNPTNERKDIW